MTTVEVQQWITQSREWDEYDHAHGRCHELCLVCAEEREKAEDAHA